MNNKSCFLYNFEFIIIDKEKMSSKNKVKAHGSDDEDDEEDIVYSTVNDNT
jgi:hypothetical protein